MHAKSTKAIEINSDVIDVVKLISVEEFGHVGNK